MREKIYTRLSSVFLCKDTTVNTCAEKEAFVRSGRYARKWELVGILLIPGLTDRIKQRVQSDQEKRDHLSKIML